MPPELTYTVIDGRRYDFNWPTDLRKLPGGDNRTNLVPFVQGLIRTYGPVHDFRSDEIPTRYQATFDELKERFGLIADHTVIIDKGRFAPRMPKAIADRLRPQTGKLTPHAGSTIVVGRDDVDARGNPYAWGVALSYVPQGIPPATPIRIERISSPSPALCDKFLKKMPPPGEHCLETANGNKDCLTIRRLIESDPDDGSACTTEYCRLNVLLDEETMTATLLFLWQYQQEAKDALRVLSENHPNIHPGNLAAAFYELAALEFYLFNPTDIYQDIAASEYADSPQHEVLKKNLPRDWKEEFITTLFGERGWRAYSWYKGVPIEHQGLGPLQIIPGLAQAAFEDTALFHSYEGILSPDDFSDYRHLIKAIFDPAKMFALKAMTWDLQLRQLEQLEGLTTSPISPPHIPSEQTTKDLALLFFARQMVQFPRLKVENFLEMLESDTTELDAYLVDLHLIAQLQGVTPRFDGISRTFAKECPPESFGSYQLHPEADRACLTVDRSRRD